MPSLNSQIVSLACRAIIKRRLTEPQEILRHLRFVLKFTRAVHKPTPRKAQITEARESNLAGEWIEWKDRENDLTMLFFPGGGYIACSAKSHRPLTLAMARHARARVFALNYRVAPEHPFPAALDDAIAAYRLLLRQGVAPQRLIVSGVSAGGGLALALLVALRDAGEAMPAGAVCMSPWADLACTGESLKTNAETCAMFHTESFVPASQIYLNGTNPTHPLVSPLYADLTGFPPLQIFASNSETLRDDAVRMAERARQFDVNVDLQVWDGLPHVWPIFYDLMPEARKAVRLVGQFTRECINNNSQLELLGQR